MASMLFSYKGRTLNPPVCHETGWGSAAELLRLDRLIGERGLKWWLTATDEEVQSARNAFPAAPNARREEK